MDRDVKILHHHLGLGDHLICYGLVRELKPDYLLCKWENLPTVKYMYRNTDIKVIAVKNDYDKESHAAIKIGFTDETMTEEIFGTEFYKQAGLPYETRWRHEIDIDCYQVKGEGNFIHLPFEMEGFKPSRELAENIFCYKDVIENAPEVHVMESSFRQLIEFLNPKGKLFLHFNKEKSWRVVPSRHNWNIIY